MITIKWFMYYCFIDESGDLGFDKNSSDWFFLVVLITANKRELEKLVKKFGKQFLKRMVG